MACCDGEVIVPCSVSYDDGRRKRASVPKKKGRKRA